MDDRGVGHSFKEGLLDAGVGRRVKVRVGVFSQDAWDDTCLLEVESFLVGIHVQRNLVDFAKQ